MSLMRALVTGSAGFVGRHMVNALTARDWDVTGIDSFSTTPAWLGDARDVFDSRVYAGQVFDLVVHCAYHVGGRAKIDGEPRQLARNLELDARMFDWAARTGQPRVLYFSSSAAYPTVMQQEGAMIFLREDLIDLRRVMQPDARYGWAKLTGEQLAAAAAETGVAVHVVRPFSGHGEDQDPDEYPMPAIVRRVVGGDLTVWGPPGQVRDWIHIDDVVAGALAVVDADERRPVNLCTGVGTEFGALALRIADLAGVRAPTGPTYLRDKPTGVMVRVGNPERMFELYHPRVSLDEGIRRAIATHAAAKR